MTTFPTLRQVGTRGRQATWSTNQKSKNRGNGLATTKKPLPEIEEAAIRDNQYTWEKWEL